MLGFQFADHLLLDVGGPCGRLQRVALHGIALQCTASSPLTRGFRGMGLAKALAGRSFCSSSAAPAAADAFRRWGHWEANLDPLGNLQRAARSELSRLSCENEAFWRSVYCSHLGAEFMHLDVEEERNWWASKLEKQDQNGVWSGSPSPSDRRVAARMMLQAHAFESFLSKRFPGFKRYSGEGAETMVPILRCFLLNAARAQNEAAIIGMPHRGRLAFLATQMQYPLPKLFQKISGRSEAMESSGFLDDVTSHISAVADIPFGQGCHIQASLLHNPSHLEHINPVAAGKTKATQNGGRSAICMLVHGDAAVSGQGVVPETVAISSHPDFSTGGVLHLVVNNQIGFTTAPITEYCTGIAMAHSAPILHVNGADPDCAMRAASLAAQYREKYRKDAWVDLFCFRKHGHNEVDEPSFTNPLMYRSIREGSTGDESLNLPKCYARQLEREGLIKQGETEKWLRRFDQDLHAALKDAEEDGVGPGSPDAFRGLWSGMGIWHCNPSRSRTETGVPITTLRRAGLASVAIPKGFTVHTRLLRNHINDRKVQLKNGVVDWSTAEALAFGSLLLEGYSVRLCGQDSPRGTFSQRHACFTCQEGDKITVPFSEWDQAKGTFSAVGSPLSELAVLGFEYGYSLEDLRCLCIWEAQFGDFWPGASTIVDQFISSGEAKWLRQTGIVMLLPHGVDGAGPEHSSGRMERLLQLSNDPHDLPQSSPHSLISPNMYVCQPTNPASYFHLLRQQQLRKFRKPLIILAPKVLLRHAQAVSPLSAMDIGTSFQPILDDPARNAGATTLIFCSGKIYYDIMQVSSSSSSAADNVAVVRLEQIAPWPADEMER
jgi:probable 2-oxoglutarate dehydrogenase E1 component DHKTD1